MIIKNFLNKIYISKYTYFIILLFLLCGLFKDIIIISILIIIHEFGHYLVSYYFKWNIDKINIYPFGGLIKYNEVIDKPLFEEFLISISGIIFQICIYIILIIFIKDDKFLNLLNNYNYNILLFNIIPIIPLDGSKVINVLLNKVFNFRISYYLLLFISIIFNIFLLINYKNLLINSFLLYELFIYIKNKDYIFNKFLLEKYLYNDYHKYIYINSIKKLKRNKRHLIKYKNNYISIKNYIKKDM